MKNIRLLALAVLLAVSFGAVALSGPSLAQPSDIDCDDCRP